MNDHCRENFVATGLAQSPGLRPVSSQHRRLRHPHLFGSGVSFTHASSARILCSRPVEARDKWLSNTGERMEFSKLVGRLNMEQEEKKITLRWSHHIAR